LSHRHSCDYKGHGWECDGTNGSVDLNAEPVPCRCVWHGEPIEDGDHTMCPVELLACPEHREEQQHSLDQLRRDQGTSDVVHSPLMLQDKEGDPTVGFCFWCDCDFSVWMRHDNTMLTDAQL